MSSKAKNQGETENFMVKVAERATADTGARVFWRSDPTLAFNLSQVRHYLEVRSRNGDEEAIRDLAEIDQVSDEMKSLKATFFKTDGLSTKKETATKYRAIEAKMLQLLCKGA